MARKSNNNGARAAETESLGEDGAAGAQAPRGAAQAGKPTVSHMLGEMVWLLTQSPLHKHFALADLEWMVMPPLMLEQYRIFRDTPAAEGGSAEAQPPRAPRPVGLALWALLSEEAEQRLNDTVMAGRGPAKLRPDEWRSGDRLWLVDLVAPFATAENRQVQAMMTDLVNTGLKPVFPKAKDGVLKFHKTDPKTGEKEIGEVTG